MQNVKPVVEILSSNRSNIRERPDDSVSKMKGQRKIRPKILKLGTLLKNSLMEGDDESEIPACMNLKHIDYSELNKISDMIEQEKELSPAYTLAGILRSNDIEVNNTHKPSLI